MDYNTLINQMTPEIYQNLKSSLELSKWPNGQRMSEQQKEACMEAIIAYEYRFKNEQERTGYIEKGKKVTPQGVQESPINLIDILQEGS
ncbi:YeaC family protein [Gynuella sp.]|uniref:YeaC family protein n=1 Tax=Gynuella sp. TaxID=2969146 RepID=UPI003D0DFDE0